MITQRQTVDRLTIAIEAPERPQLLIEQEVVVTLTNPEGRPVEGAEVWLALIMPTMQMSPNEPDATAEGGGRYRAKTLFTMSGTWEVEVHATVQGQEHIATFHASTL
jgi:nitrogen fixation protein FixH